MPSEEKMAQAVEKYLGHKNCLTAREVPLDGCRLDVVAYDKTRRVFRVVECKDTSRAPSIGKAFGQLAAYFGMVSSHGHDFVDAASKKLTMRYGRWMEATEGGKRIHVEFYVCLPDEACRRVELMQGLKKMLPHVGIIRFTMKGHCRNNIWVKSRRDSKLAEARRRIVRVKHHH